jgi:uncharacterized membrane protein (DUF2068 family)
MSVPAKAILPVLPAAAEASALKRAPTLYAIILFKVIKGALFFVFGVVLYCQASHDLPGEWGVIEHVLRIHPENKFFQNISEQIAVVTKPQVHHLAVGTMIFSLFPLVEGIGMLYRAGWAGWLAIGESAFFVPIEIYELARRFSLYLVLVMVVNILIVWYLYAYRETLFHHHQPRQRH